MLHGVQAEKKEHQEESARSVLTIWELLALGQAAIDGLKCPLQCQGWAAKMADLQTDLGAASEKLTKLGMEGTTSVGVGDMGFLDSVKYTNSNTTNCFLPQDTAVRMFAPWGM